MNRTRSLERLLAWMSQNSALVALIIAFPIGAVFTQNFLTRLNVSAILFQYAIIGLLALGQLVVILTGGIDLAQGAVVALTSIVTAALMRSYGIPAAVLGGLAGGTLLGFVSGLLVSRTKIPPFVVTLGMTGHRPRAGPADLRLQADLD